MTNPTSVALPKSLARWRKQLELFPEVVARDLGLLADRLAFVLGPDGTRAAPQGEFDGFSGLSRRGSYERLLPSEWLLQEALPEEFIRRATAGEHSFFDIARRSDTEASHSVALFDAGCDQLGAPRVVQLALLIVLARRAESSGRRLAWGILQDRKTVVHESLTKAGVRTFLASRSNLRPSPTDTERWTKRLEGRRWAERWVIGSDRLEARSSSIEAERISVAESLELGAAPRVEVRVHRRQSTRAGQCVLELPPSSALGRILRDPFEEAPPRRPATGRIAAASPLVFSIDGRRLWARGAAGELLTIPIPNSVRAKLGHIGAVTFPADAAVVAVGLCGKRTRVVVRDDDGYVFHLLSKRGNSVVDSLRLASTDGSMPSVPPRMRALGTAGSNHTFWVDGDGILVEATNGTFSQTVVRDVMALRPTWTGLAVLAAEPRPPHVVATQVSATGTTEFVPNGVRLSSPSLSTEAFFGDDGMARTVVHRRSDTTWTLVRQFEVTHVRLTPGSTCVGCVELLGPPSTTYLVVLDDDRTGISLKTSNSETLLLRSSSRIASITVSDVSREIAYLTEAGELVVFSSAAKQELLRMNAGEVMG